MKKFTFLLLCAALGICSVSARNVKEREADGSHSQLFFGYDNGEINDGLGAYPGYILTALIEIPEENAQVWKGNKVVGLKIGLGNTAITEGYIMLTQERSEINPLRQEEVSLHSGWNTIMFNEPWEIDGNKFYAGYQVAPVDPNEKPIGTDGRENEDFLGGYIGRSGSWSNITAQRGNLCIQVIIEGEYLPQYDITLSSLDNLPYYQINEPFSITAKISNKGVRAASSLGIECTVDGKPATFEKYIMTPATLQPGEEGLLKVEGLKYAEETSSSILALNVTSVNDEQDSSPDDNTITGSCSFASVLYPRAFVMEEWTGTLCQYCPYGIITMNHMRNTYGDENFIGIAVHGGDNEPMTSSTFGYVDFLNQYAKTYPGCVINRTTQVSPEKAVIEDLYKSRREISTVYDIQAEAVYDKEGDTDEVTVSTVLTSSIDVPQCFYTIALAVIEDGVGPYWQENFYNGMKGDYDGWESKGSRVYTEFNDVARDIDNWDGITGSVPSKLVKMQPNQYTSKVSIKDVSSVNNSSVVVLLIDYTTGEILNARKIAIGEHSFEQSGVENGGDNAYSISIDNGLLTVAGDFRSCDVYSVDGKVVTGASSAQSIALDPGIYVIRVVGNDGVATTRKHIIR